MNTQVNGKRFESFKEWEKTKNLEYDYAAKGITNKILSKPIANSDNPVLRIILNLYDSTITYMLKAIDILRDFKNIHSKNR